MKQIKYLYNGGLPLSQDVLKWQQEGYQETILAICSMGYDAVAGDPVIITGCEDVGAGVYSAGWIYNGTDLIYFEGGDSVAAGTTNVKVVETTTSVVFGNGASQAIYSNKKYSFDNTGTDDITDLKLFQIAFGGASKGVDPDGIAIIGIAGGTGNLSGQLDFRKFIFVDAMQVVGAIVVQTPSGLADPPAYQTVGTLTSLWIPAKEVHFKANIEGYILETGGTLKFNDVNGRIKTNGDVDFQFIKPDAGVANYTVKVNVVVPLT